MKKLYFNLAFLFCFYGQAKLYAKCLEKGNYKYILGIYSNVKRRPVIYETGLKNQVLVYQFDFRSKIDPANLKVTNVWVWQDKLWQKYSSAPLPDAVYDYSFTGKKSLNIRKKVRQQKNLLVNQLNIPFFVSFATEDFVRDKLEFAKLMKSKNIPHPKTESYSSQALLKMLNDHSKVYLKPVHGYQSRGIIVVSKIDSNFSVFYELEIEKDKWHPVYENNILTEGELLMAIENARQKLKAEKMPYILQEGIEYFAYQGKKTFFRVITQRGRDGNLDISGAIASIGGGNSRGGFEVDYQEITKLWENFENPRPSIQVEKELFNVALQTHQALEEHLKTQIGELGLDLVIDRSGKVTILEANNKPGYAFFDRDEGRLQLFGKTFDDAMRLEQKREQMIIDFGYYLFQSKLN